VLQATRCLRVRATAQSLALTAAVWRDYVEIPEGAGQDEAAYFQTKSHALSYQVVLPRDSLPSLAPKGLAIH
jgi:hypothetical protein